MDPARIGIVGHIDGAAADKDAPFAAALPEPVETAAHGDRRNLAVLPRQPADDVGLTVCSVAGDVAGSAQASNLGAWISAVATDDAADKGALASAERVDAVDGIGRQHRTHRNPNTAIRTGRCVAVM